VHVLIPPFGFIFGESLGVPFGGNWWIMTFFGRTGERIEKNRKGKNRVFIFDEG